MKIKYRRPRKLKEKNDFVGMTLVSNDINKDIKLQSYNDLLDAYENLHKSLEPLKCPNDLSWRLTTLKDHDSRMPFFPLFPFDCDRTNANYENGKWKRVIEFWGLCNQVDVLFTPSPSWILIQHAQMIYDLLQEVYVCENPQDVLEVICHLHTSLANFKTTIMFSNNVPINAQDMLKNVVMNINNIKYLKEIRDSSHPVQYCICLHFINNNMKLQKHHFDFLHIAVQSMPTDEWTRNEIMKCVAKFNNIPYNIHNINDCYIFLQKHINLKYFDRVATLNIMLHIFEKMNEGPRISRHELWQLFSNTKTILLEKTAIDILRDIQQDINVENCIASLLIYGNMQDLDFYNDDSMVRLYNMTRTGGIFHVNC